MRFLKKKVIHFVKRYKQGENEIDQVKIRKELQQVMWDNLGIIRTREGILEAIKKIEELDYNLKSSKCALKNNVFNRELLLRIENESLISIAKCICVAALEREESRGSHYRSDFSSRNDKEWRKNIIVEKTDEYIQVKFNKIDFDFINED